MLVDKVYERAKSCQSPIFSREPFYFQGSLFVTSKARNVDAAAGTLLIRDGEIPLNNADL